MYTPLLPACVLCPGRGSARSGGSFRSAAGPFSTKRRRRTQAGQEVRFPSALAGALRALVLRGTGGVRGG